MRYDARYEAARATNQSDRGWDFRPTPEPGSARAGWIIVAICFVAALFAGVL